MSGSMSARIALVPVLAVGFYLLALGIAGGSMFFIYAQVMIWDRFFLQYSIMALIGAVVILWSILPRLDRFEPPGPLLKPDEHPELFAEIERVAGDVQQTMFVCPGPPARVANEGQGIGPLNLKVGW